MSIWQHHCRSLLRVVGLLAATLIAASAFAHHSPGNITGGQPIKWEGTISKISWDGAHVMYRVDVANADGSIHSWQILGGSPQRLAKRGISQRTLHTGDRIVVAGYLNQSNRIISPVYVELVVTAPVETGPLKVATLDEERSPGKLFVGYFSSDEQFVEPSLSTPP
jgi:hypothetical protein